MRPSARTLSTYAALLLLFVGVTVAIAKGPPPKDDDPSAGGELYGDLYVLERDGNGEPILYPFEYEDSEGGGTVEVECAMPLAGGCSDLDPPLNLNDCSLVPLNVEKEDFDPEVEDACGAQVDYAQCLQEVSFGRGSVARSQPFVIDSAYAEFIKTINEAVDIGRDPAGRVKLQLPSADGPLVWKTIDAPLENLGLYREVMINNCLGTTTDEVIGEGGEATEVIYALDESAIALLCGGSYAGDPTCAAGDPYASLLCDYPDFGVEDDWWLTPETPDPAGMEDQDLLWATTFIAGATDKGDPLALDEIVNINTYLGINTYTFEKVKKERILTVTYFDFGSFMYEREDVFEPLITTDYLLTSLGSDSFLARDVELFSDAIDGVDLDAVNLPVCRGGVIYGNGGEDPLICDSASDETYLPENEEFGCGGANWFAQAAEHARKTVWYLHNWEVPEIAY